MINHLLLSAASPLIRHCIRSIEGGDHLPERGGCILAANHIDFLDGFFISAAVRQRRPGLVQFLSETNNYWWTAGSTIPIDRSRKAESLALAERSLAQGNAICIFPEGRRNSTSTLLAGHTGAARLALQTGIPVIPIGMLGPSGSNFAESCRYALGKRAAIVRFGPALRFPAIALDTAPQSVVLDATNAIMSAIGALCQKTISPRV